MEGDGGPPGCRQPGSCAHLLPCACGLPVGPPRHAPPRCWPWGAACAGPHSQQHITNLPELLAVNHGILIAGNCQFRAISFGLYGAPGGQGRQRHGRRKPHPALSPGSDHAPSGLALLSPPCQPSTCTAATRGCAAPLLKATIQPGAAGLCRVSATAAAPIADYQLSIALFLAYATGILLYACPCRHAAAPRLRAAAGCRLHATAPGRLPGIPRGGVERLPTVGVALCRLQRWGLGCCGGRQSARCRQVK